jgi:DNA-damage-inducible protein J
MNTMTTDARVTIRVDKDLKERAEILFQQLGLNMSTACNIFLRKSVEESAIPFPVSTKTGGTIAGFSAEEITKAFKDAVSEELKRSKELGLPIARYDTVTNRAYIEYADGTREYVDGK